MVGLVKEEDDIGGVDLPRKGNPEGVYHALYTRLSVNPRSRKKIFQDLWFLKPETISLKKNAPPLAGQCEEETIVSFSFGKKHALTSSGQCREETIVGFSSGKKNAPRRATRGIWLGVSCPILHGGVGRNGQSQFST